MKREEKKLLVLWSSCLHRERRSAVAHFEEVGFAYRD